MHIRHLIRAPKAMTKVGHWNCGAINPKQKMGPKAFDLGGRRPFQLGNRWWWRVDHLECGGGSGRLLIAYHLENENYLAWLAMDRDSDVAIAACLEFHGTHPGWHYHVRCADLSDLRGGVQRQRNEGIRIPGKGRYHRQTQFGMGPQEAVNRAYRAFNVGVPKEGDLL